MESVAHNTLVFGILHTGNEQPPRHWRMGPISVFGRACDIDSAGRVDYREARGTEVVMQDQIAFIPTIHVALQNWFVMAFTVDDARLGALGP